MGKRSLKASTTGQAIAKRAFDRTCWTQEQLALEVGLNTRQSVWKFFSGRPIDRHIFIDLCFKLDLDWEAVADLPRSSATDVPAAPPQAVNPHLEPSVDDWVQQARQYLRPLINKQCGVLQSSLNIGRPLSLEALYTPVRIIPHLRHQQWLDVEDLKPPQSGQSRLQAAQPHPEAIDGVEIAHQTHKALLLGKPGSGKTTFLKHLANQCIAGQYQPQSIPIFVTLRHDLANIEAASHPGWALYRHIQRLGQSAGLTDDQIRLLLSQGRFLLLLDGLDEVPKDRFDDVLQDIQNFSQTYPENACLLTNRLTSEIPYFSGFLNIEIDDFCLAQIEQFVRQWFIANVGDRQQAEQKIALFLDAIDQAENGPIKELLTTPILLSLLCSVFLGRSSFPKNRAKLYQSGLDILLTKWDQSRGIQRAQIYQELSVPEKLKLLGKIAASTFEREQYFFEKTELAEIIVNYLIESEVSTAQDLESLYAESEAIIHSIQLQHGLIVERAKDIYSFSHLTFQEYLTARKILYHATPESLPQAIQNLANHALQPAWHEVLRLTANMITQSDPLLEAMHQVIQQSVITEPACTDCLRAIAAKVDTFQSQYQPAAVRAFYLSLFGDRDLRLATALDGALAHVSESDISLDLSLARVYEAGERLIEKPDVDCILNFTFALELEQKFQLNPIFHKTFCTLKNKLPEVDTDPYKLAAWWTTSGPEWLNEFRALLIRHRQIAQTKSLNTDQQKQLWAYYQLNLLLVECWQDSKATPEFSEKLLHRLLKMP
ncbi:MAG: NACHT domain-containing protein [Leptolyngbyaceae cyanobacterium]